MYSSEVRFRAQELMESGLSLRAISMSTGINRATLRDWRDHPEKAHVPRMACPRCAASPTLPEPRTDYAYLLGLYLGDGCISVGGAKAKGV
jgi:transposase-like protein